MKGPVAQKKLEIVDEYVHDHTTPGAPFTNMD